jgi:hypothetical protein
MFIEMRHMQKFTLSKNIHNESSQPWTEGKIKETENKYNVDETSIFAAGAACMLDTITLMTGITDTQRQTKYIRSLPSKHTRQDNPAHTLTPFHNLQFPGKYHDRPCLTLCVILRQPPFFK